MQELKIRLENNAAIKNLFIIKYIPFYLFNFQICIIFSRCKRSESMGLTAQLVRFCSSQQGLRLTAVLISRTFCLNGALMFQNSFRPCFKRRYSFIIVSKLHKAFTAFSVGREAKSPLLGGRFECRKNHSKIT